MMIIILFILFILFLLSLIFLIFLSEIKPGFIENKIKVFFENEEEKYIRLIKEEELKLRVDKLKKELKQIIKD